MRILIANAHPVSDTGLRGLLHSQPDFQVVAEVGDATETLNRTRELNPDVILLTLDLPGNVGVEIVHQLHQACPATRLLVLTAQDQPVPTRAVLAAGGAGIVCEPADASEILTAIHALYHDRLFLSIPYALVRDLVLPEAPTPLQATRGAASAPLSEREQQVLLHLAQGFTNKEIGEMLQLSSKTVGTYRIRLSKKLGMRRRSDFVQYARAQGLLSQMPPS